MGGYVAQSLGVAKTHISTVTGFSVNPTFTTNRYIEIGDLVFWTVVMGNGTSNAATFTITGPFPAANTGACKSLAAVGVDNGAALTDPPRIDSAVNSNIFTIHKTMAAGTWTTSNAKRVEFTIVYERVR